MFRGLLKLYSYDFAGLLVQRLQFSDYRAASLLMWFWQTKSFETPSQVLSRRSKLLVWVLSLGGLAQITGGVWLLADWARFGTAGAWEFGAALLISYPLVAAHALAVMVWVYKLVYYLGHPKMAGRQMVCTVLEHQARVLRRKHPFKLIAVAGSVGKTSTKLAIADLLGQNKRVRHQAGNYNDRVTVPLVLFGQTEPGLFNIFAWFKLFGANQAMLSQPYPYDVVVVELGTDGPGQIQQFAYLHPDISVVTAVSPEHMEYFKTLDMVAAEELAVFEYSERVLVNADTIAGQYLAGRNFLEYSLISRQANYFAAVQAPSLQGQTLEIQLPGGKLKATVQYIGAPGAGYGLAAAAVADMLGVKSAAIAEGLPKLVPFAGRMHVLAGLHNSTLIDDTYNASPLAVCAALDVLYSAKATQRIAILGSMNELGEYSEQAHREVGIYCDPKKLDVVVTIGYDAEAWLAPAAKKQGCKVHSFVSPQEAGEFVARELKKGAVVLAKGSQNGVFAEEALKLLLADPADAAKLARQTPYWLARKAKQFVPR